MSIQILQEIKDYYSYTDFLQLCSDLLKEGKTTSNSDQKGYVSYAQINFEQMEYWNAAEWVPQKLRDQLKSLPAQTWYVITEGWCGDSAAILPIIYQMSTFANDVSLKIILRDTHPEAIDLYLTNGGRSIPKLVVTENNVEKGNWGPRPVACQQLHRALSDAHTPFPQMVEQIEEWYKNDKGQQIMDEISKMIL